MKKKRKRKEKREREKEVYQREVKDSPVFAKDSIREVATKNGDAIGPHREAVHHFCRGLL